METFEQRRDRERTERKGIGKVAGWAMLGNLAGLFLARLLFDTGYGHPIVGVLIIGGFPVGIACGFAYERWVGPAIWNWRFERAKRG